ncbi:putative TetR-family transcriptional regulator [Actinoplanes missouriensis 431]|uniref:Putative TetR-family transcriptional regulator n=1 Tax=Actinoplanes missouriensis (strain ATCC 14538 / DSM 43046 / CBS 188.64 / JCM 3121 / NBRC 102363 / NCIMB 12654 / NRRL B-3342 / UNCC 431) TaxID=512565 RepID=I0H348_ACTM4|nr:TetR/AcrR family transcriptional regulator [Actinoplanes missouriensis]BAL87435.1 putative TetR-family transcriptional regulator [Actinoplanes missouriensis 431]
MTADPARRNERSRRAILTAALDLLGETGYADLTIEAIAARAGVGKQTIYRWWRKKGAIILEALVDAMAAAEAVALPDTGDLAADLRTVMRATVAEFADPKLSATTRAITIETLGDESLGVQVRDQLLRPQLDAVKDRLRAGRDAGQVRDGVDLDQAVELLFGPLYHRWLLRTGPLTDDYADGIVELAVAAIRPDRK